MNRNFYRRITPAVISIFLAASCAFPAMADGPESSGQALETAAEPAEKPFGPGYDFTPDDAAGGSEDGAASEAEAAETGTQGDFLGDFSVTGYCNCSKCSGGHNLTYSGTVPKAKHTISADIDVFPIGTKLMIDGTVYTVEDIGGGVYGNRLDIYFATHEEALNFGRQTKKVYAVK